MTCQSRFLFTIKVNISNFSFPIYSLSKNWKNPNHSHQIIINDLACQKNYLFFNFLVDTFQSEVFGIYIYTESQSLKSSLRSYIDLLSWQYGVPTRRISSSTWHDKSAWDNIRKSQGDEGKFWWSVRGCFWETDDGLVGGSWRGGGDSQLQVQEQEVVRGGSYTCLILRSVLFLRAVRVRWWFGAKPAVHKRTVLLVPGFATGAFNPTQISQRRYREASSCCHQTQIASVFTAQDASPWGTSKLQ